MHQEENKILAIVEGPLVKGNDKTVHNGSENAEVLKGFSLYLEEGI